MPSIQVRILAGSGTGRQIRLTMPVVSFGRDPQCDIVLDQPFVSREHGRLRVDDGKWVLVNQSSNATTLGRRRVKTRPRAIPGPTTVTIGDQQVFEILQLEGTFADETARDEDTDQAESRVKHGTPTMSGRAKLWLGIGVYLLVMFALFLFFSYGLDESTGPQMSAPPELTAQQIEREIRQPLEKRPPDSRRVAIHNENALSQFNQRRVDPAALYHALDQYKLSQAFTKGPRLKSPTHERRFVFIKNQATDRITSQYRQAYVDLRKKNYQAARKEFRTLMKIYPDHDSPIYHNAQQQWDLTKQALNKRHS